MAQQLTLAFDVYGTLIDTQGVTIVLQDLIGERAKHFAQTWRDKQLEYSFRRGLMQNYENFDVCTGDALDYTCLSLNILLTKVQKQNLLNCYQTLPAFGDVKEALTQLQDSGFRLYGFSNGVGASVKVLLESAGLQDFFLDIISADEIKTFKPNPAIYQHFLNTTETSVNNAWLVSSNPFDVIGAVSAGMHSAWVKRSKESIFDPWGLEPTLTVASLLELTEQLTFFETTPNLIDE